MRLTDKDFIENMRWRFKRVSPFDRKYERPMNWEEAERLLDYVTKLEADTELHGRILTQRFARSSPIEERLMAAGLGKKDLPTREECLEWSIKLGVPDDWKDKETK